MERAKIEDVEMGNLIFGQGLTSLRAYSIDRNEYEEIFFELVNKLFKDPDNDVYCSDFENDVFAYHYFRYSEDTDDDTPNFVYKPDNVEITWYKYPLRDSFCSHDLTVDQFKDMINKCIESIE